MSFRPRIAIPVPTSFDPAYNAQCWPEYATAIEQSGGTPVRIELTTSCIAPESFDGIVLPGSGADIRPEAYGHERHPETGTADPLREAMDRELLALADRTGLPLLGICFGLQSLNVYRGGTLVQDLPPIPINHRAGRSVLDAHTVVIADSARLPHLAPLDKQMVNSSHHQAVAALGEGLLAVALASEDGVIEAVEDSGHPWMLGVQWHPERTSSQARLSGELFGRFIEAARIAR